MTVGELKKFLGDVPDDLSVVIYDEEIDKFFDNPHFEDVRLHKYRGEYVESAHFYRREHRPDYRRREPRKERVLAIV